MSNGKLEKWTVILQIIQMFMPIVEWAITKIEQLFKGIKTGEEKKEIAMKALEGVISDKELRGKLIDTVVSTKNATGEFSHSA